MSDTAISGGKGPGRRGPHDHLAPAGRLRLALAPDLVAPQDTSCGQKNHLARGSPYGLFVSRFLVDYEGS